MIEGDEDFDEAMSGVVPLKRPPRAALSQTLSKAQKAKRLTEEKRRIDETSPKPADDPNKLTLGQVPDVTPNETLAWKQDGVQDRVFKKLKQGAYEVRGELDLHRRTVKEARVAVYDFLRSGVAKGWRTVSIAHGRGEKSPTPARIKSYVNAWLRQSPHVIAFHSALPRQGGTGAVYVLLRKSDALREENRETHGQKTDPHSHL